MYHRRTAVFLLSSGIFKTHEERPCRLVEFTLSRGRVSTNQTFFASKGLLPPLFPNHSLIFSRVFPLRINPYVSPESLEQATFILSCSANLSDISFACVNMSYFVFIGIDLVLKGRLKWREKGTKQVCYERCVCVNRLK